MSLVKDVFNDVVFDGVDGVETSAKNKPNSEVVYDKNAYQKFPFETEGEDERFSFVFAIENLPDDVCFEFNKLQETQIIQEGKNQRLKTNNQTACRWFFDNQVKLVEGFEGELPADWQTFFNDDDAEKIVMSIFEVTPQVKQKEKTLSKFSFKKTTSDVIVLIPIYSGQETLCKFSFPLKTNKQINSYKEITEGAEFKKGREGMFVPPNWKNLCGLYDDIGVECDSNVAAHIKVMAMRERFESNMQSQKKKLRHSAR